ncbi:MAG: hypothetical protein ACD_42C00278G0003 [uncultured bacterium]|nr:MAG: hypothetical protein ACD_42C00278G0003 [uncultured bacterium]OGT27136.1 MAG: phosphoribosylformylglycinamidine synthase I [Gammaproteobacteria bacterium RIFCSPHIGHO2_02_FULL_42_43]OGT29250.1 MAG: phosphoribosylformylglycinamidine synthase I [Gammaproteobacteria bacterium RIFCSPHIGHO2_01_FULL_42_8]OGT50751.1 MAG: phosphoribosylformylglycinamidine synthase I [Gammaproteobacteria bacterium RIFCSPHIGHO2_12_FULL_41_25]OGT61736.1 MAG: phosphoribosylformylglycinamidine synthase I [Gammaproteob
MTFQIGVIQFPGSNCERETKLALLRTQLNPVDIFWFSDADTLEKCDGYVIVGGFSYEDRARSGVIAAHDPLMKALTHEAKKGKPILGICNGAQILVESGLVPGCVNENNETETVMALAHNRRILDEEIIGTGFYNAWMLMKAEKSPLLKVPVAHGEGRFLMSDDLYALLQKSNVLCWYYVDENGNRNPNFPTNPNGAYQNLAAVGNFSGNILAMMPHPERTIDGNFVFENMRHYLENRKPFQWITKKSQESFKNKIKVQCDHFSKTYFVRLAISDNESISVQMALQKLGLDILVQKYRFWGLNADEKELTKIENSFELWNPQKENVYHTLPEIKNTHYLLVNDFGDTIAAQKALRLKDRIKVTSLSRLTTGIIWQLTGSVEMVSKAIKSHLLFNPISQQAVSLNQGVLCQT